MMHKIKVQKLTHENFHRYGTFAPLIDPLAEEAAGSKDAETVFSGICCSRICPDLRRPIRLAAFCRVR